MHMHKAMCQDVFSFGYVNGCLWQSCHATGCHIATKCVSNDGQCGVKRCQSGGSHASMQARKHVKSIGVRKQVSM